MASSVMGMYKRTDSPVLQDLIPVGSKTLLTLKASFDKSLSRASLAFGQLVSMITAEIISNHTP